ncbi:MAG TPA: histidine phosphatase family protein [Pyrinomonadaceae bacterium]|nr:histidine phosphatase family protein [Pyrinomonadaceae bacterium]
MRTLYLLRHAKSSWKDASLADFDRPLKGRGREAAEMMGRFLATKKTGISALISSPSVRTRQTVEILLRHALLAVEPEFDRRIYEASLSALVQVAREIPTDVQAAMLVGHNPGMEELLAFLTHENMHMPTCALAKIGIDGANWSEIGRGAGKLEWFVTPKDLPED